MPVFPIDLANAERAPHVLAAVAAIRAGELVAFPTETVYGLGADATNGAALAAVFERKGRPRINPLIVHVPDAATARALVEMNTTAERLAAAFWPGPLTLVLPKKSGSQIHDLASAGLPTLAIRVPAHPVAQALLRTADRPIAAPSANASGEPSPTLATHVATSLGSDNLIILDGGPTDAGIESTVIGFEDGAPVLLRLGALTREDIAAIAGPLRESSDDPHKPSSPGRLLRHYAPRARLRLNAEAPDDGELYLAFGPSSATPMLQLSTTADPREAAANLFALLREADALGAAAIAVAPIPDHGIGEAINDRLRRAAAAQA